MIAVVVGPMISGRELSAWAHATLKSQPGVAFIAVDGGYHALFAARLPVTAWIGDGDSLASFSRFEKLDFAETPAVKLPKAKDRSDLAFALGFCSEGLGVSEILAVGFQGGRIDHEHAALLEFSQAASRVEKMTSFGPRGEMHFLSGPVAWKRAGTRSGQILSVFPAPGAPSAQGVRYRGLRFQPRGGILETSSQGLSNVAVGKQIEIRLRKGGLVVILPAGEASPHAAGKKTRRKTAASRKRVRGGRRGAGAPRKSS